jgi:hypothetical protein
MMQRGYKAAGLRCPSASPSLRVSIAYAVLCFCKAGHLTCHPRAWQARKGLRCRCEAAATVQRVAAPSQAAIHSSAQPRTTRTLGPAPHAPLVSVQAQNRGPAGQVRGGVTRPALAHSQL